MYLFLPEEETELASIHQALLDENMAELIAEMQQTEDTIFLPKFKLDNQKELNDILKALGMEQAFDEEGADFPKMIASNDPVYISEMKQRIYLDINEDGTEAAGSTSIGMETTSLPIEEPFNIKFNRPFFMLITDEATGAILFAGDIRNPSL